jgi:adenosylmethionine-8-amino-7-oxononanoate aminotransferase
MQEWLSEEPLIIASGEGSTLVDGKGDRYLDGVSSLWCNIHGHRRKEIDEAIREQLDLVAHTTLLGLSNIPSILLAQKLVEITPVGLTRVFYSDAGATAVEVALKLAVQYWQLKGRKGKVRFASLVSGYHGDTLGAISLGYSELFHRFFRPLTFETLKIRPPHLLRVQDKIPAEHLLEPSLAAAEEVLRRNAEQIAALIVEPLMQGAAGMWAQPAGYLRGLRKITQDFNILLICDEVATGFGRTGRMFACAHEAVSPDLLCLGKGISGGYLPLAATLTTEEIFAAFLGRYEEFKTFFHGHTYTGNPLGCAAGLASLKIFNGERTLERLQPRIRQMEERLREDFLPLPHVGDVRQWGFMVGIELVMEKESMKPYPAIERLGMKVIREARKRGALLRPLGDVIILMPPLSITQDELSRLLDVTLDSIRAATEGRN